MTVSSLNFALVTDVYRSFLDLVTLMDRKQKLFTTE